MKPTNEFYGSMQGAYDHFNETLFNGQPLVGVHAMRLQLIQRM